MMIAPTGHKTATPPVFVGLSPGAFHEVEVVLEGLRGGFLHAHHVGILAQQVLPDERLAVRPHPVLFGDMRLVALRSGVGVVGRKLRFERESGQA